MAAADWRSAALIASIRRRGNAPSSSSGWNDTDFLAAINEELRSYVVPLIRRVNEDYLVAYTDVSVVSGTARYRIPEAALGEALKDVGILDAQGNFQPLNRIDSGNRDVVSGYYLEDEDVVLFPTPTSTDTLRLKYIRRPSKVVADSRCYSIDVGGINTSTGRIVTSPLDGVVDLYTFQSAAGQSTAIDVVSQRPGFRTLLDNAAAQISQADLGVTPAATTLGVVANALLISAGDYVCVPGESPVPQIPAEAHPLLGQAVLCQYLRASSQPGLQEAEARRAQMEQDVRDLFAPRTENQPKVVINRFGAGWAGNARSRTWGR